MRYFPLVILLAASFGAQWKDTVASSESLSRAPNDAVDAELYADETLEQTPKESDYFTTEHNNVTEDRKLWVNTWWDGAGNSGKKTSKSKMGMSSKSKGGMSRKKSYKRSMSSVSKMSRRKGKSSSNRFRYYSPKPKKSPKYKGGRFSSNNYEKPTPEPSPKPTPKPVPYLGPEEGDDDDDDIKFNGSGWCHLHKTCKASGHTGLCCPTFEGEYLDCCEFNPNGATPTSLPTTLPTLKPTALPTSFPTLLPTKTPTERPTANIVVPTALPTGTPTNSPTSEPTSEPTTTTPTSAPTTTPPTSTPTDVPTLAPTTTAPTSTPTDAPTLVPTNQPTNQPTTSTPTGLPSALPTSLPSALPSSAPTASPTTFESVLLAIAGSISTSSDIQTAGTPANLAFERLLNDVGNGNACDLVAENQQEIINRYILSLFYFASNGPDWNFCTPDEAASDCPDSAGSGDRFLSCSPACDWFNVTCADGNTTDTDPSVDDISIIQFNGNNVGGGPIPTELGELSSLRFLFLEDGTFTGPIPTELFNLGRLRLLSLKDNLLSGEIPPEIVQLSNLEFLILDNNQLAGGIPSFLSQITSLRVLSILDTDIGGVLPDSVALLSNLEGLGIQSSIINGTIPTFLGDLSQLTTLNLFNNNLNGTVPTELGQLTGLRQLFLHFNDLSGTMPEEICALRDSGPVSTAGVLHSLLLTTNCIDLLGCDPDKPYHEHRHFLLTTRRHETKEIAGDNRIVQCDQKGETGEACGLCAEKLGPLRFAGVAVREIENVEACVWHFHVDFGKVSFRDEVDATTGRDVASPDRPMLYLLGEMDLKDKQ
eukprot:scaffold5096_cov169-Amphora_coffeaeformis.AAC.1